ncbi:MAG: hypothetical protein Tsb0021_09170 [Chlamydiales bacterium]
MIHLNVFFNTECYKANGMSLNIENFTRNKDYSQDEHFLENLRISQHSSVSCIEKLSNIILTPVRYLFNGYRFSVLFTDASELTISHVDEIEPCFQNTNDTKKAVWIKTALSVALLVPSILIGGFLKFCSLSFERQTAINHSTAVGKLSPREEITIGSSEEPIQSEENFSKKAKQANPINKQADKVLITGNNEVVINGTQEFANWSPKKLILQGIRFEQNGPVISTFNRDSRWLKRDNGQVIVKTVSNLAEAEQDTPPLRSYFPPRRYHTIYQIVT